MTNNLALSYIRCSTPEQLKGDTVRRQLEGAQKYCNEHGLILSEEGYADLGLSAFKGQNLEEGSELMALVNAIEAGRVQSGTTLVIENLDRLSRSYITTSLPLFLRILKKGVKIVTLSDGKCYDNESVNKNPMDLMFSIMVFARGHEESEIKRQRVKASWDRRKKTADTVKFKTLLPAWLKWNDARTDFVVIPERAEVVKRIYQMFLNGMSTGQISKTFNLEGLRTLGHNRPWLTSTVQHYLKNAAVCGEYRELSNVNGKRQHTGRIITDYYPTIVSKDDFLRAQSKFNLAPNKLGRPYSADVSDILYGLMKCPYCNASIGFVDRHNQPNNLYCWNAKEAHCMRVAISKEFVYAAVLTSTKKIPAAIGTQKKDDIAIISIEGELAAIKRKIENLLRLAMEGGDVDEVRDMLKQMKEKQTRLQNELDMEKLKDVPNIGMSLDVIKRAISGVITKEERALVVSNIRRYVKAVYPYFLGNEDNYKAYREEWMSLHRKNISASKVWYPLRQKYDIPDCQYVRIEFLRPIEIKKKVVTSLTLTPADLDRSNDNHRTH